MKDHYIPESNFPVKLNDHLFMLGNYFFNLFLVIGEKKTALFEVGISAIVDAVIHQLENLGIDPDFIVCSHPHSDHITGLPGLIKRFPDAKILAAKGAESFVNHPKAGPVLLKEDAYMSKSLEKSGIIPGRPSLEKIPDLSCVNEIEDTLRLDLGDIFLDLSKIGGHSPGNLIGMIHEQKILFSSDSLGFHFPGRGFLPLFFTEAEAYIFALKSIQEFSPSIICPAHQGALKGDAALKSIQTSFNTTMYLIKKVKASKKSDEALAAQIFKQYYKDEFTIYTKDNIKNCTTLLVKRAKQADIDI
ncbi:MAG: MBL fold metallo-hydrolase [Desulfobacula sp.]|nr:MBL fold metallo-hydrolase [Desulfobacula sp.]